ncbi:hypothetical protein [Solidesulfovibrio sp.]
MTAASIKEGDYVTHKELPKWGLGKVVELLGGVTIRVFFEFEGEKKMQRSFLSPAQPPAHHPVLGKMDKSRTLKGTISFPSLEAAFLKMFPGGFDDPRYIAQERSGKIEAAAYLQETLSRETMETMLAAGDYDGICLLAKKLLSKTSLIFPNEKTALADGLKKGEAQRKLFATALAAFLYGDEEIGARFNAFVAVLDELDACKWTTASYFLFLIDPMRHVFIKPAYFLKAAEVYGFDIGNTTRPGWACYQRMLELVAYVAAQLARRELLQPRDLIDVQGFLWCSLYNAQSTIRAPKVVPKGKA